MPAIGRCRGPVCLDENSLGALPAAASARVTRVVEEEWGAGLVRSWNAAGWITAAQRVGDKIAGLTGAGHGEVIVADSTSANLYKVLSAAIEMVRAGVAGAGDGRRRIVSERTNFPTDLYIADTLARAHGFELVLVDADDLAAHTDERLAVLRWGPVRPGPGDGGVARLALCRTGRGHLRKARSPPRTARPVVTPPTRGRAGPA